MEKALADDADVCCVVITITNFQYGALFDADIQQILIFHMQILKLDVSNGAVKRWGKTDCSPSEPVFVPHPEAQNEDDGNIQFQTIV